MNDPGRGDEHLQATRDSRGRYLMVYSPMGKPITVRTSCSKGEVFRGWWFDPRMGEARPLGDGFRDDLLTFQPPSQGEDCDWVLVLDSAAEKFPAPGTERYEEGRN